MFYFWLGGERNVRCFEEGKEQSLAILLLHAGEINKYYQTCHDQNDFYSHSRNIRDSPN